MGFFLRNGGSTFFNNEGRCYITISLEVYQLKDLFMFV
jgi:hypothetical protein